MTNDTTHPWDRALEGLRAVAVCWLLLVGLWSGPWLGATLVYPNGLLTTEIILAIVLLLLARRGRVVPLRGYPFLWPCLGALALAALAAGLRVAFRDEVFAGLRLWQAGEPMLRGLLLYLALAGQPRLQRLAWSSALAGLALLAGATILQHVTGMTRWYLNLNTGWATGIYPVPAPSYDQRAQGLTSYINLTAAILAAALPLWVLLPLLRVPARPWGRAALLFGGVATAAALWYTGSRGPIIAAAVVASLLLWRLSPRWGVSVLAGLAFFLLAVWPALPAWALGALILAIFLGTAARWWRARYLLPVALGLGMAGGLQVMDAYVLGFNLKWRVAQEGISDHARLLMFREAVRLTADAPLWGVGDAGVAARLPHLGIYGLRHLPWTQQNAHNQYLHWAAAEGLPVAFAFTLLVGWGALWCWRRAFRAAPGLPRAGGLAIAAGLTIFLLTNLADAHFWRIEGGGFFWSLLGLACALLAEPQERE